MSVLTTEPANEDVAYFNQILKAGVEGGCSDVHIKVGTPASFRISRAFHSIDFVPTQAWMTSVIDGICPKHMRAGLEALRDCVDTITTCCLRRSSGPSSSASTRSRPPYAAAGPNGSRSAVADDRGEAVRADGYTGSHARYSGL